MSKKPDTIPEAQMNLRDALLELLYQVAKSFGTLKLIGKLEWLDYRPWVKSKIHNETLKEEN